MFAGDIAVYMNKNTSRGHYQHPEGLGLPSVVKGPGVECNHGKCQVLRITRSITPTDAPLNL